MLILLLRNYKEKGEGEEEKEKGKKMAQAHNLYNIQQCPLIFFKAL